MQHYSTPLSTLIPSCNSFESECNATLVCEGDEEENHNIIDEHTKQWVIVEFKKAIDIVFLQNAQKICLNWKQ